mmetsp:Transcript_115061/g.245799  ORF Transcript_115061/g.245799 Transcript_115061/m.245799 type:complete len:219 (+) Transcript_115061:199-855(+)
MYITCICAAESSTGAQERSWSGSCTNDIDSGPAPGGRSILVVSGSVFAIAARWDRFRADLMSSSSKLTRPGSCAPIKVWSRTSMFKRVRSSLSVSSSKRKVSWNGTTVSGCICRCGRTTRLFCGSLSPYAIRTKMLEVLPTNGMSLSSRSFRSTFFTKSFSMKLSSFFSFSNSSVRVSDLDAAGPARSNAWMARWLASTRQMQSWKIMPSPAVVSMLT